MLLEDLEESAEMQLAAKVETIRSAAKETQAAIEDALPSGERHTAQGIEKLRTSVAEPVARMLASAHSIQADCSVTPHRAASGLGKIVTAAENLRASIANCHEEFSAIAPSRPATSNETLLVVDDHPEGRELLSRRLERKGPGVPLARAMDVKSWN
jgi:hypothetical protein